MRTHATSIAAAALLLVTLAACQPGTAGSPTQPATAASSPAVVYPAWYRPDGDAGGAGILSAGSHATTSFVPGFTFTVPEGWVNDADMTGFYSLFPDVPANAAEMAASGSLAHGIHMGLVESPYFLCEELESNRGATAAEMAAAIVGNEYLAVSEPVDVTVGGLTGTQVDVQADPGWTGSCPGDPPELDLKDMRARGTLLDVPDRGVLVIFTTSLHAAGHDAFLAEAMPILASFQFDAGR